MPLEIYFGQGKFGIGTATIQGEPYPREIVIHKLPEPVLPVGSDIPHPDGMLVEDLADVLVRIHFENVESARVMQEALEAIISGFHQAAVEEGD